MIWLRTRSHSEWADMTEASCTQYVGGMGDMNEARYSMPVV